MNNNKTKLNQQDQKKQQHQVHPQHQEHQQQKTRSEHGSGKQDQHPETLHKEVKYHEQELPETRMFD